MNPESQQVTSLTPSLEEQFLDRIAQVLDAGAVSIMLSIGHKLSLFDTLAKLPPSTSGQIAEAATLSERYIREWLAVMVVAEIISLFVILSLAKGRFHRRNEAICHRCGS